MKKASCLCFLIVLSGCDLVEVDPAPAPTRQLGTLDVDAETVTPVRRIGVGASFTVTATTTAILDGGTAPDSHVATSPDALPSVDTTPLPDAKMLPDTLSSDLLNDKCAGKPDGADCAAIPFCDAEGKYVIGMDVCQSGVCVPQLFPECRSFNCDGGFVEVVRQQQGCSNAGSYPYVGAYTLMRCKPAGVAPKTWRCPDASAVEMYCKMTNCVPI